MRARVVDVLVSHVEFLCWHDVKSVIVKCKEEKRLIRLFSSLGPEVSMTLRTLDGRSCNYRRRSCDMTIHSKACARSFLGFVETYLKVVVLRSFIPPLFIISHLSPCYPLIPPSLLPITTNYTTIMPSIRLTLVNNAKQTQKSAVILKVEEASDPLTDILTLAKNKLRLKKAKTLYLNHGIELADPSWLKNGKVAQDRYPAL